MKSILLLLPVILITTSCLKSTEDLRREKLVDQLDAQMQQSQKLVADLTVKLKDFEQRVATVGGQVETIEHNQNESISAKMAEISAIVDQLKAKIAQLEVKIEKQDESLAAVNVKLTEQRGYVKKVSKTLGSIAKKSSYKPALASALKLINKGKYKSAKPKLEELLAEKLSAADRNKVYHGLGLVAYDEKKYDSAIVYFSKIYSKWPRSSMSPNSLYYIGKSFLAQGKTAEAKQIFDEVVNKYPKKKQAEMAKKESAKIK